MISRARRGSTVPRSRIVGTVGEPAIRKSPYFTEVLAANPETSPLDIETALRAATSQAYLVANSTTAGFEIVLGMQARDAALADAGLTVEQNWAALAGRK